MNNRLWNIKNPYQTSAPKVLALCSAGLLRSPTVANVLHEKLGCNTRAAGITDYALIEVDMVLLEWADEIVCVEPSINALLGSFLHREADEETVVKIMRKTTTLKIPDHYEWNDPKLREEIWYQYRNYGGKFWDDHK